MDAPLNIDAELQRSLIDSISTGLLVVNQQERVVYANNWIKKYYRSRREFEEKLSFIELFPDLAQGRVHRAMRDALDKGHPAFLSHTFNPHPFPVYAGAAKYQEGIRIEQTVQISSIENSFGWFCLIEIRDISAGVYRENLLRELILKHQEARTQAESANRSKSQFVANMSHDIRTPLNSILGYAEVLSRSELSGEQAENLAVIRAAGDTLLTLLSDILDFSRMEADKLKIVSTHFKPLEVFELGITPFYQEAINKNITLEYELMEGTPEYLMGDPLRIKQIIFNLVSNAVKFTSVGGVYLHISYMPKLDGEGPFLELSVLDTGVGVAEDEKQSIFETFVQADGEHTREFGGTGLGLAIVKRLVNLMGGEIQLHSPAAPQLHKGGGAGCEFTVRLPVQIPDAGYELSTFIDAEAAHPGENVKLLVAEDNEDNRILIQKLLGATSVDIDFAVDGNEAVMLALKNSYDLILMDIQMPEKSGHQATREIREKLSRHVPIVALTAHAYDEDVKKSLESGMDDHLTKPITKNTLLSCLEKYTGTKQ